MAESEEVRSWIALAQRDPRAWLYEADRLRRAADLVGSRFQAEANEWLKTAQMDLDAEGSDLAFQLGPTARMLIGYAIEVLAKGLIVAADQSDETVDRIGRTHIDAALLQEASVEMQAGDAFLVDQTLYHAVRWFGRYPVPRPRDGQRYADQVAAAGGSIFSHPGAIRPSEARVDGAPPVVVQEAGSHQPRSCPEEHGRGGKEVG
jgi:hypothetical protein